MLFMSLIKFKRFIDEPDCCLFVHCLKKGYLYIYVKNQIKLLKIIKCSNDKSVVYNWTNNMNEICDIVLLDSWQNI